MCSFTFSMQLVWTMFLFLYKRKMVDAFCGIPMALQTVPTLYRTFQSCPWHLAEVQQVTDHISRSRYPWEIRSDTNIFRYKNSIKIVVRVLYRTGLASYCTRSSDWHNHIFFFQIEELQSTYVGQNCFLSFFWIFEVGWCFETETPPCRRWCLNTL